MRRIRALGLRAIQVKKFKVTTDSNHSKPVAPDLLEWNVCAAAPNQKWTTDITYVWTDEGWLYLAMVMNLYSRAIVGHRATCYDNALTESFFHSLKVGLVHRQRYTTRRMSQTSIFEYIETYYHRQRKHSAIGYRISILFDNAA
jgi:putative transposase